MAMTAAEFRDASDPATSDTMQQARYVWADEDGNFLNGSEALDEMKAMAPLDRARVNAALAEARALLKAGNWREAQGPLVTAEQIAASVDARHVVRELLSHLRALRAYGNKTNSPDSWKGQAGDREWPRMTVELARAYERVEHGRVEHVGGYQGRLPEVTAAEVEHHLATAHGRGPGFARAMSSNPLQPSSRLGTDDMLAMHEAMHRVRQAHEHEPHVITRTLDDAREFQHQMVSSAFVPGPVQAQGHHTVQGHPREGTGLRARQEAARQRFQARHNIHAARRQPMSDTLSLTSNDIDGAVSELSSMMGWDYAATYAEVRERAGGERDPEALALAAAELYREAAEADGQAAADPDELAASNYSGPGFQDGYYVGDELELSDSYPPEPTEDWHYDPALELAASAPAEVVRLAAAHPQFFSAAPEDLALSAGTELVLSEMHEDPESEVVRLSMMADEMNARQSARSPAALKEARLSAIHDTTHQRTARGHKRGCPPGCTRDHRQPKLGGHVHPEVERYLSMLHTRHPDGQERPHGNTASYHPGRYT